MNKLKFMAAAGLLAAMLALSACGGTQSGASSVSGTGAEQSTSQSSASADTDTADISAASAGVQSSSTESLSSESTTSVSSESAVGPDANVTDVAPDLSVILTEIQTDVEIGTAGSSLKATIVAADVLDFTMSTDISEEHLEEQTAQYMEGLSEEDRTNFPDQMVMLGETIHTLKDGDAQSLLDDAGVTESAYPWNDEAYTKADAILRGAGI
jgi:hypothetical protein